METPSEDSIPDTDSTEISSNLEDEQTNANYSGDFVGNWKFDVASKVVADPHRIPKYLIFIILFCLLSMVANVRVVWVIIEVPKQRFRPMSILIAHLSCVAIVIAFIAVVFIGDQWDLVTLIQPGACQKLSSFRHMVYNAYPLSVASIFQEMVNSVQGKLGSTIFIKLLGIWLIAWLSNIPITFMGEYDKGSGNCKEVSLFGGFGATLTYEFLKFLLLHVMVAAYIIYAMTQIRLKISSLKIPFLLPNNRFHRRLQMIRYIHAYSIIFVGLWLPTGAVLALLKIFAGTGFIGIPIIESVSKVVIPAGFAFIVLSPLIYVSFVENTSAMAFCLGREASRYWPGPKVAYREGCDVGIWGEWDTPVGAPVEGSYPQEMSRVSTLSETATRVLQISTVNAFPVSTNDPGDPGAVVPANQFLIVNPGFM